MSTDRSTGARIPIFDCSVGVELGGGNPPSYARVEAKGERGGEYEIRPGTASPDAPNFYIRMEAQGYLPATSRLFAEKSGDITYDFALERKPGLQGRVSGPDGRPVAGAEVYLAADGQALLFDNGSAKATVPRRPTAPGRGGQGYDNGQ